jgi:hypothetical protein
VSDATHVLDVYGVELHLATTVREWKKLRKRVSFLQRDPAAVGLTQFARWEPADGGRSTPIVAFWISQHIDDDLRFLVETCAHEANHAASLILTNALHDVRGDDGIDEPTAYLAGWIAGWLFHHCAPVGDRRGGTRG